MVTLCDILDYCAHKHGLSISSSCNKSVKIRLAETCHLENCYNSLKQLAESLWITSFDNQLATCGRIMILAC